MSQKDRLITILEKVTQAVNMLLTPVQPENNFELEPIITDIESQLSRLTNPPVETGLPSPAK